MNNDIGGFATFDNINNKLIDDLKVQLREGCKLQIAAASFSIYAYEALKEELEAHEDVVVYTKLPRGFYINTPMGKYNPDWAIALREGEVKHVYFVAETKGGLESGQLRAPR